MAVGVAVWTGSNNNAADVATNIGVIQDRVFA